MCGPYVADIYEYLRQLEVIMILCFGFRIIYLVLELDLNWIW